MPRAKKNLPAVPKPPQMPRGGMRAQAREQIQDNLQQTIDRLEEWEKSDDPKIAQKASELKLRYGLGAPDTLTKDELQGRLRKTRDFLVAHLGVERYAELAAGLSEIWDS